MKWESIIRSLTGIIIIIMCLSGLIGFLKDSLNAYFVFLEKVRIEACH